MYSHRELISCWPLNRMVTTWCRLIGTWVQIYFILFLFLFFNQMVDLRLCRLFEPDGLKKKEWNCLQIQKVELLPNLYNTLAWNRLSLVGKAHHNNVRESTASFEANSISLIQMWWDKSKMMTTMILAWIKLDAWLEQIGCIVWSWWFRCLHEYCVLKCHQIFSFSVGLVRYSMQWTSLGPKTYQTKLGQPCF